MISTVVGLPGGGKSFYGCKCALDHIAKGGLVVTNIRFNDLIPRPDGQGIYKFILPDTAPACAFLKSDYGWTYKDGQYVYINLKEYSEELLTLIPKGTREKHVLVILDEVNKWFDSADRGRINNDPRYRHLLDFLRMHRHYHIDVMFLLQDFSTLNNRLRNLSAKVVLVRDIQNVKVAGIPFKLPLPFFLWQERTEGNQVSDSKFWFKDPRLWSCYDSFEEFEHFDLCQQEVKTDFSEPKKEKKGKKRMSIYERILVYGLLLFLGIRSFVLPMKQAGSVSPAPVASVRHDPAGSAPSAVVSGAVGSFTISTNNPESVREAVDPFNYVICDYQCVDVLGYISYYVNGSQIRVGDALPRGEVLSLTPNFATLRGWDGSTIILCSSL